jgi:short-subunit dehydrogenase
MLDGNHIFSGLKVLDLASFIAGPAATTIHADFGADVVKVEPPVTGDPYRFFSTTPPNPASEFNYAWQLANRNKRSIALDLKSSDAKHVLLRLVRWADVVVINFPPRVKAALGVTYDALSPLNPRLIYADVTGYWLCRPRDTGPRRHSVLGAHRLHDSRTGRIPERYLPGGCRSARSPLGPTRRLRSDRAGGRVRTHPHDTRSPPLMQGAQMIVYRGSTALVTGASKGLGEAFAEALSARGLNLVLVARSVEALRTLAKRLTATYGVQCLPFKADLSDPSAANQIGEELERQGIRIDLLINNAGLGLTGDFLSHDIGEEQAAIQVNVQALVALTHLFGSAMAIRGDGGIINIASNSAFQPLPHMATYAAAKAFVLHFSEALQHELKIRGVRVMAACPGPTAISFFDGTSTALSEKDMDSSEAVVQKILEAFDRGKAVAYPGRMIVRAATWLPRLLPRTLITRLAATATTNMGLHN